MVMNKVSRDNLAARVYANIKEALMQGRFTPGQRLKITEMAAQLGVSDTPVREAFMQLIRERALISSGLQSFFVPEASFDSFTEVREIRLLLEPLAATKAALLITAPGIDMLETAHRALIDAEQRADWRAAVYHNYEFHLGIARAAGAPSLLGILESLWLQTGPALNLLYPHALPKYAETHQHDRLIECLRQRDAAGAGEAARADIEEGGASLVRLLKAIDDGSITTPMLVEAAASRRA